MASIEQDETPRDIYALAPSDLVFLWEECRRCFYDQYVRRERRPRTPMPSIFIRIDALAKGHFEGMRTSEISPLLPTGIIRAAEGLSVRSQEILVPGHARPCVVRGRLDGYIEFDDGTYGLLDFKTTATKEGHIRLYGRQLHAYAWALEHAAPGALNLAPVSCMGLLCLEPVEIFNLSVTSSHEAARTWKTCLRMERVWLDCQRDDTGFLSFLGDVLETLDGCERPSPAPKCGYCRYRASAMEGDQQ